MASPKLQFLPSGFVVDLLSSHFSNRLFDLEPSKSKSLYVEDKEINQTLKPKTKFNKFQLLPIIAALVITIGLILVLALTKLNYLIILLFVFLYVLDALLAIIQQCKLKFDSRFMK